MYNEITILVKRAETLLPKIKHVKTSDIHSKNELARHLSNYIDKLLIDYNWDTPSKREYQKREWVIETLERAEKFLLEEAKKGVSNDLTKQN